MGKFLGTKIVESRFYENPADPANSDWSIFLPKTAIEAVAGLQTLLDLMENQLQSLQQKFQSLFGFPISGTVNTFAELPNSAPDGEHWLVLADETRGGIATIYKAYGGKWEFVSEFELSLDVDWDNLLTRYDIGVLGGVEPARELMTAAQAQAGTDTVIRSVTAQRIRQAIDHRANELGGLTGITRNNIMNTLRGYSELGFHLDTNARITFVSDTASGTGVNAVPGSLLTGAMNFHISLVYEANSFTSNNNQNGTFNLRWGNTGTNMPFRWSWFGRFVQISGIINCANNTGSVDWLGGLPLTPAAQQQYFRPPIYATHAVATALRIGVS